jgi:hypothetical protein
MLVNVINGICTIKYPYNSSTLIRSLVKTRLIVGATVTNDYTRLIFKATSVTRVPDTLDYKQTLQLIYCLASQIKYLVIDEQHCFYTFSLDNLYMIDGDTFVYISNDHLMELDGDQLQIVYPFSKDDEFISPEMHAITYIPATTHYKTIYYSLALIIKRLYRGEESYALTQLLRRCICEEPSERTIVFL